MASGGTDAVDGGNGIDLLELQGGLEDYRFVRNADDSSLRSTPCRIAKREVAAVNQKKCLNLKASGNRNLSLGGAANDWMEAA